MKVLFVTYVGLMQQSAQAVLNYFRTSTGFTHMEYAPAEHGKVFYIQNGSIQLHKSMTAEFASRLHFNTNITGISRSAGGTLDLTMSNGTVVGGFNQVILAVPAYVAQKLTNSWLAGRILRELVYDATWVTLHEDSSVLSSDQRSLKIGYNTHNETKDIKGSAALTGFIARSQGHTGDDTLLTVHYEKDMLPNYREQHRWLHHPFTVWELLISWRFVDAINGIGGVHFAGDWTTGVGHNDAMMSGIKAACGVGMERNPSGAPRIHKVLRDSICREPK